MFNYANYVNLITYGIMNIYYRIMMMFLIVCDVFWDLYSYFEGVLIIHCKLSCMKLFSFFDHY